MQQTFQGLGPVVPFELPAFLIAFQPIVDVATRSIVAYEALTRGMNGCSYPQLTAHLNVDALRAFHRSAAEVAIRRAAALGLAEMNVSLCINILPDVHADALDSAFVLGLAREHGLRAANILLEFTEDHRLPLAEYRMLLERNKQGGFATGMDDFGAGYSGLSALAECRPEILKLDRSLVVGIDTSYTRQRIVSAFADCCKALDIQLIAEGIESVAECDMLLELGITHMQGFLFSHAVVDQLPVESVWGVDFRATRRKPAARLGFLAALGLQTRSLTLPA